MLGSLDSPLLLTEPIVPLENYVLLGEGVFSIKYFWGTDVIVGKESRVAYERNSHVLRRIISNSFVAN